MIASRSPSDKRPPLPSADAVPAPPQSEEAAPSSSRTTSVGTTATNLTAATGVSSVTFAAADSEEENSESPTRDSTSSRHAPPPSRSYASFASDTSFVLEHNDSSLVGADDDEECAAKCSDRRQGNDANAHRHEKGRKEENPIERARHHFASHQTNHERSEESVGSSGPSGSGPAPLPPKPSAETSNLPVSQGGQRGKPPLGSRLLQPLVQPLVQPLRRHYASHSVEPTSIPHLHSEPSPSLIKTQQTLSTLIQTKRQSLRPVEVEFLEHVAKFGCEEEVECAIGRLKDDNLFFVEDTVHEQGGEEGEIEVEASPGSTGRGGTKTQAKGMVRDEVLGGIRSSDKEHDIGTNDDGNEKKKEEVEGNDDDGKEEEDDEGDEYTSQDRIFYREMRAGSVNTADLEQMNRQLQERCSILADEDEDDEQPVGVGGDDETKDGDGNSEAPAPQDSADAAKMAVEEPIPLQNSVSMYEPRAVHQNSLDPSESDLDQARIRASSEGDGLTEEEADAAEPESSSAAEESDQDVATQQRKAKARKMWKKLGSAARIAALAKRRAQLHQPQQQQQHRRNFSLPVGIGTNIGGTADTATGGDAATPPVVDATSGGFGVGDSNTSTSTSNIASIWRAHETGVSVTSLSSERRIDQKRRSMMQLAGVASVGSSTILTALPLNLGLHRRSVSGGTSSRRAAYRSMTGMVGRDSFMSVGSLGDVLLDDAGMAVGPSNHDAEEEDKVFRRHDEDAVFRDNDGKDDEVDDSDDELFADDDDEEEEVEEDNALNISAASAPVPESPSKISRPAGIGAAADGEGGGMNRRSISVGSVRSVKFAGGHTLHEFSEDDMQLNKIQIPGDRPPPSRLPGRPPTILRRSSSLNRLPPTARRQVAAELSRARLMSADVTPVSSPTASSIPSIRHAHPIRSDSVLSVGSAVSATPSLNLHRAHPIRSDSFISVGSAISAAPSLNLHRANPIRSNSVLSTSSAAPSLNLHRAHPIRSQSFLSEIGDVGIQRNISVADSVLTFDESPITSPRTSVSADEQPDGGFDDEAITAAKAAVAAAASKNSRPVMMRMASRNNYGGEGFEVADMVEDAPPSPAKDAMLKLDSIDNARKYRSLLSEASEGRLSVDQSFKSMPLDDFVRSSMFRRTLSDDGFYGGEDDSNGDLFDFANENEDWDLESEPEIQDAWNVLEDEYAVGYSSIPFYILGTSADDVDCHPHVLSPPLMESLQSFFPYSVSEDNFYLKFSLVRDGASLHTLLQNVRGAKHTVLAIETVEGEVFGAFCSSAWRKNWNYFGSGEAFLWRMRRGRDTHCASIIDQAQMESELDVFPWTGENNFVQLCTSNKIAIGGGTKDKEEKKTDADGDAEMERIDAKPSQESDQKTSWDMDDAPPFGFGLAIEDNLLNGASSPCLTFGSPPLSKKHGANPFEILNLEVWTLTPCNTVEEAEKLELSRLFLEGNRSGSM